MLLTRRSALGAQGAPGLISAATPLALRAPVLLRTAEEYAYARMESESLRHLDAATTVVADAQSRHHHLRP
jgi:hypothetical protein